MALPQKVVDRIGRSPAKTPGGLRQLFMLATTVFLISLASYLGLEFGYRPYLESRVKNLNDEIKVFAQKIPKEEQDKVVDFYSQLANLKTILNNHRLSSPLFSWLEDNTQVNTYFTSFSFRSRDEKVVLSGLTASLVDLSEQILVFQGSPEVAGVTVGNVSAVKGGLWRFGIELSVNLDFLSRESLYAGINNIEE